MAGEKHQVVIVGASAAGLRTASRLARITPDWSVIVVEARPTFSHAACGLPYVLSGDIADAEALHRTGDGAVRDVDYFASVKGVEVLAGWRATGIDTAGHSLHIENGDGLRRDLSWDDLVLATGARPVRLRNQPQHPRVVSFHTPDDLKPLHQGLATGKIDQAVIIGAGFLGCELAEAFGALWGAEVTLIEVGDTPLPGLLDSEMGAMVAHTLAEEGVTLVTGTGVDRIETDEDQIRVVLADGRTIDSQVAVVAAGVEPVVDLARNAGVELGPTGAIAVDEKLATSQPGIWAAGDVVESRHVVSGKPVHIPLGSLANRQGRTLANILAGRQDRFPAVAGAAALKVFDTNVGAVGLSRRQAQALGIEARSVWTSAHDRADYWPEAREIALQLTFDPGTRRVLGVQAVGEGDVAKRIDVATQLIRQGANLADFTHLEHAYSPPYAPALEPLAVAAMVAENVLDGVENLGPRQKLNRFSVLDVRHVEEIEERPLDIDGLVRIPLDSLRDRLDEIDKRPWVVVCERGTRSGEAVRLMQVRGYTASYLGGGLRLRSLAGMDASPDNPADSK